VVKVNSAANSSLFSTSKQLNNTFIMRIYKILFWLTPPVLGAALYGSVLNLPFFWDDVPLFQFLYNRSYAQFWLDASLSPYYRPLEFMIWRTIQLLISPTNPLPFHAVNVIVWILAAWLVGGLALEISRDRDYLRAWLASGLFILFPFAPQAIAWVTSISHPLVTLLTVAACFCLLKFDTARRWPWAVGALVCAGLAPFASEGGTVVAGLMALGLLIKSWPITTSWVDFLKSKRASLILVGVALLLNLAYLPIWASIPKDRNAGAVAGVTAESMGQAATFFLEGLTYPVQFLARFLMVWGMADLWAVILLGVLALLGAWFLLREKRWLVWAVGYCFTAGLAVVVSLPFSYIITSPRLMSISAPASAILWAAVAVEGASRLAGRLGRENLRPWVAVLSVGAVALVPAWHIQNEIHLHHLATDQIWDLVKQVQAKPNEKTLLVNGVDWVAPVQATYVLGHEGVEVMPSYTTPQLLVWVHTQQLYDVEGVTFPLVFPQLNNLYFSTWGEKLDWNAMAVKAHEAGQVLLVRYADDKVELKNVGEVRPTSNASATAQVSFADRIWLTRVEHRLVSGTVELNLTWQVNQPSGEDIFANLLTCDGEVLGLSGGASLGGTYPIWLWQAGETIDEVRYIPLDAAHQQGCYRLELGLFDPANGNRTIAKDASGQELENDALVVQWNEP
jgi:hypothetical protein